jgi:hypothetical protein
MPSCFRRGLAALACLLPLLGPTPAAQAAPPEYARRWAYAASYLVHDAQADQIIALINRAAASGYNGLVLNDWGFNTLGGMPPSYFANARRVAAAGAAAGVEIIPAIFPVGYSEGLLKHDPNLAEGVPVVNTPFIARRGGPATLANAGVNTIVNGGFEATSAPNVPAGFAWQDDPGLTTFIDTQVAREGTSSFRVIGNNWLGRVVQTLALRPYTAYRASAWVRTSNLPSWSFAHQVIGASGRILNHNPPLNQPNQDWTYVSYVFNSLDESVGYLYAGLWFAPPGSTLWLDGMRIEELGPINVLRRPGAPVRVTSQDRKTVYQEGRDYEPIVDPLLGVEPFPGNYSYNHGVPAIRLANGSRIRDGQRVLVSWYHPPIIYGSQVTCCLSEPKVFDLLRDQARRVIDLLHPRTILMSHDEIRVANWCDACRRKGLDAGELLADHTRTCAAILRQLDPAVGVAVWSDMYDPHHNAVNNFYLVGGDLAGSWQGLDPGVTILNWNGGAMGASLSHFASIGVRQVIAGYYDSGTLDTFYQWDAAATGIPGVDGFMYTTWNGVYDWLEPYGRAMRRLP